MRVLSLMVLTCSMVCAGAAGAQTPAVDHLARETVLIVRHAEKPLIGKELTTQGEARARAYAHYFEPFTEDGLRFKVDALYGGADSDNSIRPRLTLEPLSRATGLKLDTTIGTKDPERLVRLLRTSVHGAHPLIAWRHGQIPSLLQAFGASADLIPGGKWPDDTYDWVVILTFDKEGHLRTQKLITEHLTI